MTGLEALLILALQTGHQKAVANAFLERQTVCMAQAIYYEARGESEAGREAVAEVVLNRARRAGRTICGVVFEPYQFSFTIDGSMKRKREERAWGEVMALADVYASGDIPESQRTITRGATFYHEQSVEPEWADDMQVTARIGHHIFYKPKLIHRARFDKE